MHSQSLRLSVLRSQKVCTSRHERLCGRELAESSFEWYLVYLLAPRESPFTADPLVPGRPQPWLNEASAEPPPPRTPALLLLCALLLDDARAIRDEVVEAEREADKRKQQYSEDDESEDDESEDEAFAEFE